MEALPRLVLTGASGFVGRYALRALGPRYRIVAIDRLSRSESAVPDDVQVEWHQVDVSDPVRTEALFRRLAAEGGAEVLIHLAAFYDFSGDDHPEYRRTNVDGLRNVLEGARGLGLRRFVLASSLAACGFPPPGGALTESSLPDGDHPYARSKRIGEAMLAEYRHDVPSCAVRFAALFSDWCEYPPLYYFLDTWLSERWNARMLGGRGESAVPYLHVRDAALFLRAVAERADELDPGEVLLATTDGSVSHGELYEAATRAWFDGDERRPLHVPRPLCRPGIWLRNELGKRTGNLPFERPWMADYVDLKLTADGRRTRERLGWEPRERLGLLQRMPFLVENLRHDPVEWQRRNLAILELRRWHPTLLVYQLLKDREAEIRRAYRKLLGHPDVLGRIPHYELLTDEERTWNRRLLLRNLLNAVRTRRKGLFMAYCRDLAERRAGQGFPARELVIALEVLNRACLETLEPVPEARGLEDQLHDLVTGTILFGIDQVEEHYEAREGRAIELPSAFASYRFTPRSPRQGRGGRPKAVDPPREPARRTVVQALVTGVGVAWMAGVGIGGCSRAGSGEAGADGDGEEPLVVPLASLPPGERVRVVHRQRPVELRRDGDRVVARSLVCTHFGCEVRWDPERELYACPCHDGAFTADGRVVAGPPPRPLPELPVRVEGSRVILEGA